MIETPQRLYDTDLEQGAMLPDPAQAEAVKKLQRIYEAFKARQEQPMIKKYWQQLTRQHKPVKGLYLWGGVGIGKTYLMDVFYQCLPTQRKMRLHFHQFMRNVHQELKALQGHHDPLEAIAKHLQQKTDIICFDEFFVKDIADAMILGNLLQAMFDRGISLVTTSNVKPDKLYPNGLQRDRFLPAIALIQQHTEVYHVDTDQDYRLRELTRAGVYFTPLNGHAQQRMHEMFHSLVNPINITKEPLSIEHRSIPVIARASVAIWFDFDVLCNIPRSQTDYLDIANRYYSVLLSNVPQIQSHQDSLATYFIFLVDICYDAQVKLIISAATDIYHLYPEGRLKFEFARAESRLIEMQTKEYLSLPHKPLQEQSA